MDDLIYMSEEVWEATFKPIPGPDGSEWREWNEIPQGTPLQNVWTVLDGAEHQYIVPGLRTVNFVARVVTEVPWDTESIDVQVSDSETPDRGGP